MSLSVVARDCNQRQAQLGQVLWLALVLLVTASVGLAVLVTSGSLIAEKKRLVNAADSAAYGAAIWRARAMNYQAYSNRAIIAQEVAVAQAITLASWARYFDTLSEESGRLAVVPDALEWVGQAQQQRAARAAREATERAAALDVWLRSAPQTGYKSLLLANQELLQHSAGVFGLGAVANEIVRAADNRVFAFALPDQGLYESISERQSGEADRLRFSELVLSSLDPFVTGDRGLNLGISIPDPCTSSAAAATEHVLRKRGATRLTQDYQSWRSFDLASIHSMLSQAELGVDQELCTGSERRALGWGAAQTGVLADPDGPVEISAQTLRNPSARRRAVNDLEARHGPMLSAYDGLAIVRELSANIRHSSTPINAPLAVLARKDESRLQSSRISALWQGRLRIDGELPDQRLWALSAATSYFRRPPAIDGSTESGEHLEMASLFNPYWQARLVAPTQAQRELAHGYAN